MLHAALLALEQRCRSEAPALVPDVRAVRALAGASMVAVVDSLPVDCSPYGVRGLAGNVQDGCANLRLARSDPRSGP